VLLHVRRSGALDVLRLDTRTGASGPVLSSGFNETDARWSPDNAWTVYVSDDSGQPDVYGRRADGTRVRVSFGGGTRPRWSRDGRAIFFLRGSQMMRADLAGGSPPRFTSPRLIFDVPAIVDFDVAHRSDRFLAIVPVNDDSPSPVGAVLNWSSPRGPS
jgi:Tol biopolymer transport system component